MADAARITFVNTTFGEISSKKSQKNILESVSYGCTVSSATEHDSSTLFVHGDVFGTRQIHSNRFVVSVVVVASSTELRSRFEVAERPMVAGVGRSDAVAAGAVAHDAITSCSRSDRFNDVLSVVRRDRDLSDA